MTEYMKTIESDNRSMVLTNANVITMNAARPRARTVAIRDGRITAVDDGVAPGQGAARVLDLGGRTVLPGFIDGHVHLTWTGLQETALDFGEADTVAAVQSILREAARDTDPGQVLFGLGINHYQFPDHELPTRADLDAAAPEHPVYISGVTGHYSVVNTLCLERQEVAADTPGLEPSGLLRDRANTVVDRDMRGTFAREVGLETLYRAAAERATSVGLTTVHALEGNDAPRDPHVRALLGIRDQLPVSVVVWYQTMDVSAVQELSLPRIGGCILLDGDFGPHTAALLEPYVDEPDTRGTLYHTQAEVDAFVEEAHRAGLQVAMHAVGDRAAKQAIDAYERVLTRWPREDHRQRVEHFEVYDEALAQRAYRLGVCLAIQPPFNGFFGGHARLEPILGEERAARSDPVRSLIDAGVRVGGGSDSTVTPLKPLYGVHCAVNHSNPGERIGVERALRLYTLDNAWLGFEEVEKGSIEVGKLADLVVLGEDPTAADPDSIESIPVEMTICGGEIVYEAQ
ncbi:MAG: amidohydrolase [Anaerolineae bacterium]